MQHQIEKPSEPVMRYFTPELYRRFNSADETEADDANAQWEQALEAYRKHLDEIQDRFPENVCRLAALCLHDVEFLDIEETVDPHLAVISVHKDRTIISLIYFLWDQLREHSPSPDWPFSKERVHWLYDEIDRPPRYRRKFLHRILLSDGRVLVVPFVSAVVHQLAPLPDDQGGKVRHSA